MPLLSTFHQDTLDVPDIDEDRSWCQQKRSHEAFANHEVQRNNMTGSIPSLQNRFVQAQNNEDMSVMTIDSTIQNIQSALNDDVSVSDMEGSTRRIPTGNTQQIPIEALKIMEGKVSGNPSVSSSSWVPSKTDSSDDGLRRKQGKRNKARKKFSTQTYSQGGMLYSSLHESLLDDSRCGTMSSSSRPNEKISIFENNKARGSAKLLISGTPSTQASSQASSQASISQRDVPVSGCPSSSKQSNRENYCPSVSSEPYEPEQEIVKLSIELATSKQDLDHANLQINQYKSEVIKLRTILKETQEENIRLKYQTNDSDKMQISETMSNYHGNEFPPTQSSFQTPMKSKPLDVTQETANESIAPEFSNRSSHGLEEMALFGSKGEMITPIKSPERLDQSHITCQSLYNETPNMDTNFEEEHSLLDESNGIHGADSSPPRVLFTTNDSTVSPQKEIFQGDPFATCERKEPNIVGEDATRTKKWTLQWNSNRSSKEQSTESRKTKFFFFGTSTSSVDNNRLGEKGSFSDSVSSSCSQLENKKIFGFGFSF